MLTIPIFTYPLYSQNTIAAYNHFHLLTVQFTTSLIPFHLYFELYEWKNDSYY